MFAQRLYVLGECNLKAFMQQCKRYLNVCICTSVQGKHIHLTALCYSLLLKHVGGGGGGGKAFFHVKISSISEPPYETAFAPLLGFIMLICVSQKNVGDK